MANYLKMPKKQQGVALLDLGWSYRRIEAETGVRRETVSRYAQQRRANAAKPFPGSAPVPEGADAEMSAFEGANPAKLFAGSDAKAAKAFPGSGRSSATRYHDTICTFERFEHFGIWTSRPLGTPGPPQAGQPMRATTSI